MYGYEEIRGLDINGKPLFPEFMIDFFILTPQVFIVALMCGGMIAVGFAHGQLMNPVTGVVYFACAGTVCTYCMIVAMQAFNHKGYLELNNKRVCEKDRERVDGIRA